MNSKVNQYFLLIFLIGVSSINYAGENQSGYRILKSKTYVTPGDKGSIVTTNDPNDKEIQEINRLMIEKKIQAKQNEEK